MIEREMEDLIAAHVDEFFPRKLLVLKGRQEIFFGVGRFDLLFEDQFKNNLLMELKALPAKLDVAEQLVKYKQALEAKGEKNVIMWLVAPVVPKHVADFLDRFGIEHTEIHEAEFRQVASRHNYLFASESAPPRAEIVTPTTPTITDSTNRETRFREAMLSIYARAKTECKYNAARFLQMVGDRGGLQTAKYLLHAPGVSDGFTALWKCKRLDLTVEALVTKPEWRELFTEEEIGIATKRLKDLGYSVPDTQAAVLPDLNRLAALFAPVEGRWLDAAFEYFGTGNDLLFFVTDARIGQAIDLKMRYVYFKKTGEAAICARADLVVVTTDSQHTNRLPGHADDLASFYYGFRNLKRIQPIQLSELRFYNTGTALRNDVPGASIIREPA